MSARVATLPGLAREQPASFVAFDLLADGQDRRACPWHERRARLEAIADGWTPPLQLSPVTEDLAEAQGSMSAYYPAGIEGVVAKAANGRYRPGQRDWVKVKHRETTDVVVSGVIGSLARPDAVIAGRYRDGVLVIVGRTVALSAGQARQLGRHLVTAGPGHPRPEVVASHRLGGPDSRVPLVRVEPTTVLKVAADAALSGGQWRHPLRLHRVRLDLSPEDVPAAG